MIKDIIIHDRTAPGPNTPDHPQALVPLPKTPARATALPAIVRCRGPAPSRVASLGNWLELVLHLYGERSTTVRCFCVPRGERIEQIRRVQPVIRPTLPMSSSRPRPGTMA